MITFEHRNFIKKNIKLKEVKVYNYNYMLQKRIDIVFHYISYESKDKDTYEVGKWKVKELHKTNSIKLN